MMKAKNIPTEWSRFLKQGLQEEMPQLDFRCRTTKGKTGIKWKAKDGKAVANHEEVGKQIDTVALRLKEEYQAFRATWRSSWHSS